MSYSNVAVLSAINSLLSDRYEAAGAQTFDGKRDVYASAGYPETIAPADYRRQYERQDLAMRIVEIVADYTWKGDTWLQDTEGVADSPFEAAWRALVASRFTADGDTAPGVLHYLARADIVAGMGQYAVLLLGVNDGKALSEPMEPGTLKTPDDLLYLSIFAEDSAGIAAWDKDTGSRRYGKPLAYNLSTLRGDEKKVEPVHWSRCVHIADGLLTNDVYGKPRLRAVYNRLLDIEKVLAATGEGGWRIMNPSVVFSTREGYELPRPDARMPADMRQKLEEARDEQETQIDELVHGLRRALALEGLEPHWQDTEMQDPSGAVEVYLKMISAGTGIPLRILTGSERGELASSQDEANWASVIEARRTRYAEPLILRPLVNRLLWAGALPLPIGNVYAVNWSSVQSPDPNEAAQRADTYASALQKVGVQVDGKAFVEAFVPDLPESAVIETVTPEVPDLPEAPEGEEVQANADFFRRWHVYP